MMSIKPLSLMNVGIGSCVPPQPKSQRQSPSIRTCLVISWIRFIRFKSLYSRNFLSSKSVPTIGHARSSFPLSACRRQAS